MIFILSVLLQVVQSYGTTNGVATCTMATDQIKPDICSDGAGGVIITWS